MERRVLPQVNQICAAPDWRFRGSQYELSHRAQQRPRESWPQRGAQRAAGRNQGQWPARQMTTSPSCDL
eukprot:9472258-Pyramimonas_sp.AAC.1